MKGSYPEARRAEFFLLAKSYQKPEGDRLLSVDGGQTRTLSLSKDLEYSCPVEGRFKPWLEPFFGKSISSLKFPPPHSTANPLIGLVTLTF